MDILNKSWTRLFLNFTFNESLLSWNQFSRVEKNANKITQVYVT